MQVRLPAEWEEQDAVLLAWPHQDSDWAPLLERVSPVFTEIALRIADYESVVIVAPDLTPVRQALTTAGADLERFRLVRCPTNDTWARDFGPITVEEQGRPRLLDFGFNGWGLKFAANLDNQVTRRLRGAGVFGAVPLHTPGLILEGGSIESDGRGTLLTTSECLLNPNRNPHLDQSGLERELGELLGTKHFLWLNNGYLAGDDTDSHIDTLARLAPADTILYVACDDAEDEHFAALAAMRAELEAFRTPQGQPYRLLPLPWPRAHHDEAGERLPATYANFLVINQAVLVPTYGDPQDADALAVVGEAFPDRAIIGIDCSALILQHGSLHCVTMQLPKGVLA
ncbi:agmatine deiminase family protein [Geoalkalibacter halelectricus]|uniref:agmatine deiminase family protein n=1 Tax=Geoalkalibacter halelectricus TaxID=2847045 RepID=UPI003D25806B